MTVTVKELKEKLSKYSDDTELRFMDYVQVVRPQDKCSGFTHYEPLYSLKERTRTK